MLIWDEQALLNRCRQKPERARYLISLFLEDAPRLLENLDHAHDNYADIKQLAHGIKGMASNLGALRLQDAAFDLETAATRHDDSHCSERIKRLQNEYQALQMELTDFLEE